MGVTGQSSSFSTASRKRSVARTEMLKVEMSPSAFSRSRSLAVRKSRRSGCSMERVAIPAPRRVLWLTRPLAR